MVFCYSSANRLTLPIQFSQQKPSTNTVFLGVAYPSTTNTKACWPSLGWGRGKAISQIGAFTYTFPSAWTVPPHPFAPVKLTIWAVLPFLAKEQSSLIIMHPVSHSLSMFFPEIETISIKFLIKFLEPTTVVLCYLGALLIHIQNFTYF